MKGCEGVVVTGDILSSMTRSGSGASRYAEAVEGMEQFGITMKGLLKELLRSNGVMVHTIDHRVKSEQSAKRKIERPDDTYEGFSSLHDLLGLRVTCYFSDDVDRVVEIVEREFEIDSSRSVDKGKQLGTKEFGYRSVHRVAQINEKRAQLAEYDRYKSLRFEIQLRTVVQHAWAEIEHDLGYKQETIPEPMSRRFSMLAGVLELVDYEFMALRDQLADYKRDADAAAKTRATDMSLDLATLAALIDHDEAVRSLDEDVATATGRGFRAAEADTHYLERRLAALRSVGVNSIKEMRHAVDAWRSHVIAFAPHWIEVVNAERRRKGEDFRDHSNFFSRGVGIYYLYLVMGLEAARGGQRPDDDVFNTVGVEDAWAETIAKVGPPPSTLPGQV